MRNLRGIRILKNGTFLIKKSEDKKKKLVDAIKDKYPDIDEYQLCLGMGLIESMTCRYEYYG